MVRFSARRPTKALLLESEVPEGSPVQLYLNVIKSDYGHCRVELLDETGHPIDGYSQAEADDLVVDGVRAVATWRGKSDIGELVDRPLRLRIHLQNARLYSFRLGARY